MDERLFGYAESGFMAGVCGSKLGSFFSFHKNHFRIRSSISKANELSFAADFSNVELHFIL